MRSWPGRFLPCALVLLAFACGDSGTAPERAGPPASLTLAGDLQTGPAGGALPQPVAVTVLDAEGRPVPGAAVAWTTTDGQLAPATATTDAEGRAQATWTLAPRLGAQSAAVTVAGQLTDSLSATAQMPATTSLLQAGGNAQTDTIGSTLSPVVVEVRLPTGEGLPGVAVTFAVEPTAGSLTRTSAVTDENGRAGTTWTLGDVAGAQQVTASSPGLAPVTFTATVTPGDPAIVEFAQDSLVLDTWGDSASFAATVTDRVGNVWDLPLQWSSADTLVARTNGPYVWSHRAGRTLVTASVGGASGQRPVRVVAQRNGACVVTVPITRGAPAAAPSFGPAQVLTTLTSPTWAGSRTLPVDFDGDGDDDVVRLEYSFPGNAPYSGTVRVFRSDAGTLVDVSDSLAAGAVLPDHPRDFEIRDFTGDAVPDLYVAQHGYDATPFPGAGNLLFSGQGGALGESAATRFAGYQTDAFTHGSASADVDCDGDFDIVELNLTDGAPNALWLNDGAGNFTAASADAFPIGGEKLWQEVAFIDFDRDRDPDIYLGARSGDGWNVDAILVNDGFGNFRRWDGARLPDPRYTSAHGINNAKAADFDGDGRPDLLLFEIPQPFSSVSAVRLWLNQGDGVFTDASTAWGLPAECSGEMIEPLFVVDVNDDRWPDAVLPAGCPELGGSGILINGGGSFTGFDPATIETWLDDATIAPMDVDGDGDLDLFFGDRGGNPVMVENQG